MMIDYALLEAIQVEAAHGVINNTDEYFIRNMCRWYSQTFSTPLHIVYTLPLIEIALHYFECEFKDMTEQEQQDHIANLLLTQEERKAARNEKEDQRQKEMLQEKKFLEKAKREAEDKESLKQMQEKIERMMKKAGIEYKNPVPKVEPKTEVEAPKQDLWKSDDLPELDIDLPEDRIEDQW